MNMPKEIGSGSPAKVTFHLVNGGTFAHDMTVEQFANVREVLEYRQSLAIPSGETVRVYPASAILYVEAPVEWADHTPPERQLVATFETDEPYASAP